MATESERRPIPELRGIGKEYWRGGRDGVLRLPQCRGCGELFWYPRPHCPNCGGADIIWVSASGEGWVYSYTVVRVSREPFFAKRVPYVVALIELKEGPRILSNIVNCAPERVFIGMPVQVTFESVGDVSVPVFVPAPGAMAEAPNTAPVD